MASHPSRRRVGIVITLMVVLAMLPSTGSAQTPTPPPPPPPPLPYAYGTQWCPGSVSSAVTVAHCRTRVATKLTPSDLAVRADFAVPPFGRVGGLADQSFTVPIAPIDLTDIDCDAVPATRCDQMDNPRWDTDLVLDVPDGYQGRQEVSLAGRPYPSSLGTLQATDFRYALRRTHTANSSRSGGYVFEMDFADTPPVVGRTPELVVALTGHTTVRTWELYDVYTGCYMSQATAYDHYPYGYHPPVNRCNAGDLVQDVEYNHEVIELANSRVLLCQVGDNTVQVIHPSVTG